MACSIAPAQVRTQVLADNLTALSRGYEVMTRTAMLFVLLPLQDIPLRVRRVCG